MPDKHSDMNLAREVNRNHALRTVVQGTTVDMAHEIAHQFKIQFGIDVPHAAAALAFVQDFTFQYPSVSIIASIRRGRRGFFKALAIIPTQRLPRMVSLCS